MPNSAAPSEAALALASFLAASGKRAKKLLKRKSLAVHVTLLHTQRKRTKISVYKS
jgi:hypothetical protein